MRRKSGFGGALEPCRNPSWGVMVGTEMRESGKKKQVSFHRASVRKPPGGREMRTYTSWTQSQAQYPEQQEREQFSSLMRLGALISAWNRMLCLIEIISLPLAQLPNSASSSLFDERWGLRVVWWDGLEEVLLPSLLYDNSLITINIYEHAQKPCNQPATVFLPRRLSRKPETSPPSPSPSEALQWSSEVISEYT